MQADNVTGTIITYNPDLPLLKSNLAAAIPQVSGVLIYDNGSANVADVRELVSAFPSAELIENGENLGLPVNYNKAARKIGNDNGDSWLLILDQDTVLPEGYVQAASAFFPQADISIISCPYWDSDAESFEDFHTRLPVEEASHIDMCISSGSICRVKDILNLGGFDERMFIDLVDYDYCRTVTEHNLKILQLNHYYLKHHLGESKQIHLFGRRYVIGSHSAFRKYYIARNAVYYVRKHHLKMKGNQLFYKRHIKMLFLYPLFESHKWSKLGAALKGIFDGIRMKLE